MTISLSKTPRWLSLTMLTMTFLCTLAFTAMAQQFELILPNNGNATVGRWGVRPVSTGGYIAAGSITLPFTGRDVYVARINFNGTLAWANSYDMSGGGNDDGNCVIECLNGDFALTGNAGNAGGVGTNAFVMRLNAGGGFIWAAIYGGSDIGNRLIEPINGNNNPQRDLVFCGSAINGALLARVNGANGALIWNQSYSLGAQGEEFTDVIECQQVSVGDIAAVGVVGAVNGGLNAIIRVNGNNGFIVGAPQGLALINNMSPSNWIRLVTLCEIQDATNNLQGHLVAAGQTYTPFGQPPGSQDLYVVRTGPNPCNVQMARTHGDLNNANVSVAYDIKEILPPTPFSTLTRGNLILGGSSTERMPPNYDMLLVEIEPVNLTLVTGVGYRLYDYMGRFDAGFSVHPTYQPAPLAFPTDGFIMCGESFQPGADMYIVKTDNVGATNGCDEGQRVPFSPRQWDSATCPGVNPNPPLSRVPRVVNPVPQSGDTLLCYSFPKPAVPGTEETDAALTLTSEPNPIHGGAAFTLICRSAEESLSTITITDINGKLVRRMPQALAAGETRVELSTAGWASGTYVITVTAGERTRSERIVVVE